MFSPPSESLAGRACVSSLLQPLTTTLLRLPSAQTRLKTRMKPKMETKKKPTPSQKLL
jgi:hypothetical protein